jgi:hypothetical protein
VIRWLVILLLVFVPACHAVDIGLIWDHNDPMPDGYRVFHRESGQYYDYENPDWEGVLNTCVIHDLADDIDHWFTCRAFCVDCIDGAPGESEDSNEAVYIAALYNPLYTEGFSVTWEQEEPPGQFINYECVSFVDGRTLCVPR